MSILLPAYFARLWPGFLVLLALIGLMRGGALAAARLVAYLLLFILVRDAMSLCGIWQIGGPLLWMRFARDPITLMILGALCFGLVLAILRFEKQASKELVWIKKKPARAIGWGLAGALGVAGPALLIAAFVTPWVRGGTVPYDLWPALLWICVAGNMLEELLFRGYLQARLVKALPVGRAILASGLAFSAGHALLAAQLGSRGGALIILFTLYEGLICAWLRQKDGLLAAVIAHGLGIFLVSTGWPYPASG